MREQLLGWGAKARAEVLVWQEGTSAGGGRAIPACDFSLQVPPETSSVMLTSLRAAGFSHTSLAVCAQGGRWKLPPRLCCSVAGTQSAKMTALVPAWAGTCGRWWAAVLLGLLGSYGKAASAFFPELAVLSVPTMVAHAQVSSSRGAWA